ncbi:MAG: CRTAC1 family protein [Planctomycetota bacterium]
MSTAFRLHLAGWIVLACLACSDEKKDRPAQDETSAELGAFVDVTRQAGIDFRHEHGGVGEKYLPETMGSGAAWLDFDGDGWIDLYLVNSAPLPGYGGKVIPSNRLYRNEGDGTFEDVTERARVGDHGYGMGAFAADYDADGHVDIYVTNLGPNVLYRNKGDGTFEEVAERAGVANKLWGTAASWLDYDNDGHLDLYLTNYVYFSPQNRPDPCGDPEPGRRTYCPIDFYKAQPDVLYRYRGDGTFEDVSESSGILAPEAAKGLGCVASDLDDDGDLDLFVANDGTPNFLLLNRGDGTFEDATLLSGVGYNAQGKTEACMGVACGDLDGDGDFDLFATNFSNESNTLWQNEGGGTFVDRTTRFDLATSSLPMLGFGTAAVDVDRDGWLDLVVANGHILDNVNLYYQNIHFEEPNFLYLARPSEKGVRFEEAGQRFGADWVRPEPSRGLAVADYDNDGDLDFLFTNSNRPPTLLRNDSQPRGGFVQLRLRATEGHPSAIGARVMADVDGRQQQFEVRAGESYLCTHDPRIVIGLGAAKEVGRLEIRWPSGKRTVLEGLAAGTQRDVVEE